MFITNMFRVQLKISDVALGPANEFLRGDITFLTSRTMMNFLSRALVQCCKKSKKPIRAHLTEVDYGERSTTFNDSLWANCSYAASDVLNLMPTKVWLRRLRDFCFGEQSNLLNFWHLRSKDQKGRMNKLQAYLQAQTILSSLTDERYQVEFNDQLTQLTRTWHKTPPDDSTIWQQTEFGGSDFLQLVTAAWTKLVQLKLEQQKPDKYGELDWKPGKMFVCLETENRNRVLREGSHAHWSVIVSELQLNDLMEEHYQQWCTGTLDDFEMTVDTKYMKCRFVVPRETFDSFEEHENYFCSQVVEGVAAYFRAQRDTSIAGPQWQVKVTRSLSKALTASLSNALSNVSATFWQNLLLPEVQKKTHQLIFDELFSLEDDNNSGTLRPAQVVDAIRRTLLENKRKNKDGKNSVTPLLELLQQKKVLKGKVRNFPAVDRLLEQISNSQFQDHPEQFNFQELQDLGRNTHVNMKELPSDRQSRQMSSARGSQKKSARGSAQQNDGDGDEGENYDEQGDSNEFDQDQFVDALVNSLSCFLLDANSKLNMQASHKKFAAECAGYLLDVTAANLAKRAPSSAAVWIPELERQFRPFSTKLKQYYMLCADQHRKLVEIEENAVAYWKEKICVLFEALGNLTVGGVKTIALYEEDDIGSVTPSEDQVQEIILAEDANEAANIFSDVVQQLSGGLIVNNGGLLTEALADTGKTKGELLHEIVAAVAGTANGFLLLDELPETSKAWLDILRQELGNSSDFLEKFFSFIDNDLSGVVSLEEVRIGIFMLFSDLPLPGFDLKSLPNRNDLPSEILTKPLQLRTVLQRCLTEVLIDFKAAILNKAFELRAASGEDESNEPLTEWTVRFILRSFEDTIERKTNLISQRGCLDVLLTIWSLFILPTVVFGSFVKRKSHNWPFCFRRKRENEDCLRSVPAHILLLWPLIAFFFVLSVVFYYGMFAIPLISRFERSKSIDQIEAFVSPGLAFIFICWFIVKQTQSLDQLQERFKAWRLAKLLVNGQMVVTYFEGIDRVRVQNPLLFAEQLYKKVRNTTYESTTKQLLLMFAWILLGAIHCAIPLVDRWMRNKYIFGVQISSTTDFQDLSALVVLLNICITWPAITYLIYLLSRAYNIHWWQAQSLRLLTDAPNSRAARPEPLLNCYIDLTCTHTNLGCWLFARSHLRDIHKLKEGYPSAIVAPVFFVNLVLMVIIFSRVYFFSISFDITNTVLLYDIVLLMGWLLVIFMSMVRANKSLSEDHAAVLESARMDVVEKIYENVLQTRNLTEETRGSTAGSLDNSFLFEQDPESQSQAAPSDSQATKELRVLHMRATASLSALKTSDEPLAIFGVVVDSNFMRNVLTLLAAAASAFAPEVGSHLQKLVAA
mmetsp:Transcript_34987/g.68713  ORF Transcript_34987/g.68713 Transcript_34987/m.68713 type:complete len:1367 (-) Transcript_34987:140-4240(-)